MTDEKKTVEVIVKSKENNKQVEGILIETARGIYFKPKSIVKSLRGE